METPRLRDLVIGLLAFASVATFMSFASSFFERGSTEREAAASGEAVAETRYGPATPDNPVAGAPDDALAEVARTVDGFGGMYQAGPGGTVVITLDDPSRQAEAEAAIESVFREFYGMDIFANNPGVRVRETRFAYSDLYEWRLTLRSHVFAAEGVVFLGIADRSQEIYVGIQDMKYAPGVKAILDEQNVPREAVRFEITAAFRSLVDRPETAYSLP